MPALSFAVFDSFFLKLKKVRFCADFFIIGKNHFLFLVFFFDLDCLSFSAEIYMPSRERR